MIGFLLHVTAPNATAQHDTALHYTSRHNTTQHYFLTQPKTGNTMSTQEETPEELKAMRDMFAGLALNGLLSVSHFHRTEDEIAKKSYEYADTMLKHRQIPPTASE